MFESPPTVIVKEDWARRGAWLAGAMTWWGGAEREGFELEIEGFYVCNLTLM